jgi:hypothetical protein
MSKAYQLAQAAMANLKVAIYLAIEHGPAEGLRNADLGRLLGIHAGHVGHEGHIPRTLLALMESEGIVEQDPTSKRWAFRMHPSDSDEPEPDEPQRE